jgi:F0F1-type ATP synthase assembly protein I
MMKNLGNREEIRKLLTDYSTIGMTVAFSIVIGFGIGWWLDHKIFDDTEPWCTFIGLAFGIFAGFKNLYQLAMRQDFKDDESSQK